MGTGPNPEHQVSNRRLIISVKPVSLSCLCPPWVNEAELKLGISFSPWWRLFRLSVQEDAADA